MGIGRGAMHHNVFPIQHPNAVGKVPSYTKLVFYLLPILQACGAHVNWLKNFIDAVTELSM